MVGILAVGKESRLFSRKVEYWTSFPNVSGLAEGSPVKLVGVQVGTVSEVAFPSNLGEREIRVTLHVDRAYAIRIREGTQAQLKSLSYVSQERYIELTPGDPERSQLLTAGSRIEPGVSGSRPRRWAGHRRRRKTSPASCGAADRLEPGVVCSPR
jgi:ABC-type transporter Mla subunit MlaD